MNNLKSFVTKAMGEGKNAAQIVSEANEAGIKLPRGGKVGARNVYSLMSHIRKRDAKASKRHVRRRPSMITIPVAESLPAENHKVITIIADLEDAEKIIQKFLKGYAA